MARIKNRVWIRDGFCMSWLDPVGGTVLSRRLEKRLLERAKVARAEGEPGIFLTLTYDRTKWAGPEELWDAAANDRHVPMFLRRLTRLLAHKGKFTWICKKEFQSGGYLHYHLILYGLDYIRFDLLKEAWGHGHVFAQRVSRRRIRYTAKYNSKNGGNYPGWLYDREARSVKIISVSHGFWAPSEGKREPQPRLTPQHRMPDEMRRDGCSDGLTLGDRIQEARSYVVCKDTEGRWHKFVGDAACLYAGMYILGFKCVCRSYGGLVYEADLEDAARAERAWRDFETRHSGFPAGFEDYCQRLEADHQERRLSPTAAERSEQAGGEAVLPLSPYQNCDFLVDYVGDGVAPF